MRSLPKNLLTYLISIFCLSNLAFTIYHSQPHCTTTSKSGYHGAYVCPFDMTEYCSGAYSGSIPRDYALDAPDFNYTCPWSSSTATVGVLGLSLAQIFLIMTIRAKKEWVRKYLMIGLGGLIVIFLCWAVGLMIRDTAVGAKYREKIEVKEGPRSTSYVYSESFLLMFAGVFGAFAWRFAKNERKLQGSYCAKEVKLSIMRGSSTADNSTEIVSVSVGGGDVKEDLKYAVIGGAEEEDEENV